jgi:transposase InsO family protein
MPPKIRNHHPAPSADASQGNRRAEFPHMAAYHKRTSFRCPWQNGTAERWVQSYRRDLLDPVIVPNERHLKRILSEYVRYCHTRPRQSYGESQV